MGAEDMTALWIWLALAGVLVIAEVLTVNLIFFMLAAGAAAGAVADVAGANTATQIIVAALIAALGLLFIRPVALRHLHKADGDAATNVDALIGKPARVLSTVTGEAGLVSVNGEQWSARLATKGPPLLEGSTAQVESIDGVYLRVTSS